MEKEAALQVHSVLEGALVVSVDGHRHTHIPDLPRWDVSSRSKQEMSEWFAIKNISVGKNVTRTLIKKKIRTKGDPLLKTFITRSRARQACLIKIAPKWEKFLKCEWHIRWHLPVGAMWLFLIRRVCKGCFSRAPACLHPARFAHPPVMDRPRHHCRGICDPLHHSQSLTSARPVNATVACEEQTAITPSSQTRRSSSGVSSKFLQFLVPVTWEHKHTRAQRHDKWVGLQVIPVSVSWIPWGWERSWILPSCKEQTKPQICSSHCCGGLGV